MAEKQKFENQGRKELTDSDNDETVEGRNYKTEKRRVVSEARDVREYSFDQEDSLLNESRITSNIPVESGEGNEIADTSISEINRSEQIDTCNEVGAEACGPTLSQSGLLVCNPSNNVDQQHQNVPVPFEQWSESIFEEDQFISGNTGPIRRQVERQEDDAHGELEGQIPVEQVQAQPETPDCNSETCTSKSEMHEWDTNVNTLSNEEQQWQPSIRRNWCLENFGGELPVLLQCPARYSRFSNTCTLDPGLMIMFYQLLTNYTLLRYFITSIHCVFVYLTNLLYLFLAREYDAVRAGWAFLIGWMSNDFYSWDGNVMRRPFEYLVRFRYSFMCTNPECPCNGRNFVMNGIYLPCCENGRFDVRTLQNMVNRFTFQRGQCNELMPDHGNNVNSRTRYCNGIQTVSRIFEPEPEQPPLLILVVIGSRVRREVIGDLTNGIVTVGQFCYYIGGFTFYFDYHFTAVIILRHQGRQLFYCNNQGIQILGDLEDFIPPDAVLSLIYLFRFD